MQYRIDPRSGNKLSALGLGCMRFPGLPGKPDRIQARAIVQEALDQGVNYLDTAYIYPGSEVCVGTVLAELNARDKVYLATKLPHPLVKKTSDFDRLFDEELKRLQTDHIDYYLIHNITAPEQWNRLCELGITEWIERQKAAGRIKQIGFSYHGSAGDFEPLLNAYDWDFCQIQYNYAGENYQAGTAGLKAAARRGLAVMIMEPLLGGRLAGKLPPAAQKIFDEAHTQTIATAAAWGLSWVWNHPEVTVVLSGMTAPKQVRENARIACTAIPGFLTAQELATIDTVRAEFEKANRVPCTGCNYCMPCPHGINIPGCFSAYNASYAYGWFTGVWQYATQASLRGGTPRLASNCVHCGACARKCPQHIAIPDRLVDVRKRLTPGPLDTVLRAYSHLPH